MLKDLRIFFIPLAGGSFCAVPDHCHTPLDILRPRRYASDPDMEQIVLLTLSGKEAMKTAGEFLHFLLAHGYMKEVQAPGNPHLRACPGKTTLLFMDQNKNRIFKNVHIKLLIRA